MVLLTMTPPMVDGIRSLGNSGHASEPGTYATEGSEPSLGQPAVGKPISHGQVVGLWKKLQASPSPCSLEKLLQGSRVYLPPPPPKPEPSDEYKALMARLRREEAARAYQRMTSPTPQLDSFHDRFPTAARTFAEANRPANVADLGDDDITYREVHRQVMLIINFLVSIVGVAATLWVAARWWSVPARLFLTLGGAIVVAIAEVGVYQGYVWRMGEARSKQKAVKEVREVVRTWVVGQDQGGEAPPLVLLKTEQESPEEGAVRKRRTATAADSQPDT
ncbi:hypothetical protein CDD83_4205 [Cordyceps sp. RAO-2017]|nr:hypothetical protein CDD83_4205 [Cordyceps sp. RAO-2017]